jgi:hypothetical protein
LGITIRSMPRMLPTPSAIALTLPFPPHPVNTTPAAMTVPTGTSAESLHLLTGSLERAATFPMVLTVGLSIGPVP